MEPTRSLLGGCKLKDYLPALYNPSPIASISPSMYASSMHTSEQESSRTYDSSPFKLRNLIRCIRHRPGDDKQQSPALLGHLERTSTNNSVGISEPKMLYDEDAAWSRPSSRNSGLPRRRDLGMTHIPEQGCAEMLEDENFAWGSPPTRFRRRRSTSR